MTKTEIDYEKMVIAYEKTLMTTLRGHSPRDEYLATWVPDADPVNGILNMIEAAEIGGCNQINIKVSLKTLPETRHQELKNKAAEIADVELEQNEEKIVIKVIGLGKGMEAL